MVAPPVGMMPVPVGFKVKLPEALVMKPVDLPFVLVLLLETGCVPLLYGLLLSEGAAVGAAGEPAPVDSGDSPIAAELGLEPEPAPEPEPEPEPAV